ncbi:uncharacterized protein BDCG_16851 [Blastomyces dermatitidis ER-3]|uniref:Uncharacterized protein n=1 Tax=Ajellomyces dermatitidis (strain ER-3 / ATCC MYA-2586) TaxID=559297 RepID=A0ABX2VVI7_AJEDR|nr:uncharacterized protein BDCG_16851 [Blastomyces dermatitidis ER-3]OAT01021.1 hypothetical protein BDCG_16851 [Blastomyces dermatitidis ER-3]
MEITIASHPYARWPVDTKVVGFRIRLKDFSSCAIFETRQTMTYRHEGMPGLQRGVMLGFAAWLLIECKA